MTNNMRFENDMISNVAELSLGSRALDMGKSDILMVCERFWSSVALLPKGEAIGWRISSQGDDCFRYQAFSTSDEMVSIEDYKWIFENCAEARRGNILAMDAIYEGNRKVYQLIPRTDGTENANCGNGSAVSDRYAKDMFSIMMKEGAIIQCVVASTGSESPCECRILISLTDTMPLRMRVAISFAFPNMAVTGSDRGYVAENGIADVMLKFMYAAFADQTDFKIMWDYPDNEGVSFEIEDYDAGTEHTPLERLNLGVRSFNCLRRAGIDSIEKLRSLTDEELLHIRNIGRKQLGEIRQQLTDYDKYELAKPLPVGNSTYMEMLEELAGLDEVKEHVKKIAAFARMRQEMKNDGKAPVSMALNMEFVGNPGTAKTTVARIVAGIFHETGLLQGNEIVEVGRADLIAKYEGQTAVKVKEVFQKASGKVLFIDEAYSLVESCDGEFGDEAINTIVQEMENNRGNTVVIFAGYPDKMKRFFDKNPGLRSRVPFRIGFKDYSAEEMMEIAEHEARKRGFALDKSARETAMDIFGTVAGKSEAGNGRFCRNLVENAILGYAARAYPKGSKRETSNEGYVLVAEDFAKPEWMEEEKVPNPIGFVNG